MGGVAGRGVLVVLLRGIRGRGSRNVDDCGGKGFGRGIDHTVFCGGCMGRLCQAHVLFSMRMRSAGMSDLHHSMFEEFPSFIWVAKC